MLSHLIKNKSRKTLDKLDWSNSLWGFLLGLLVLLLNVASLVIFFTISSSEHSMDEYAGKVTSSSSPSPQVIGCASTVYGTGAVVAGLVGLRGLVDRREQQEARLDLFLLKVAARPWPG